MIYSATFKIYAVNKVAEVIFYLNDNLFVFLIEARIMKYTACFAAGGVPILT